MVVDEATGRERRYVRHRSPSRSPSPEPSLYLWPYPAPPHLRYVRDIAVIFYLVRDWDQVSDVTER